jgi:hypothetical protein
MSALCQWRTLRRLFDHRIDAGEGAAGWQGRARKLGLQDDAEERTAEGLGNGHHPSGVGPGVDRADLYAPFRLYPRRSSRAVPTRRTMAMPRTITLAERRRAYATLVVGYGVAAAVLSTGVVLWLTIQAVHFF